jgi:hypothetical protein
MKKLFITIFLSAILIVIAFAVLSHSPAGNKSAALKNTAPKNRYKLSSTVIDKLNLKIPVAKSFVQKNNFNKEYCFLLDMSMPSGQKRFFVYSLAADSIISSGLVTHGNCNQSWLEGRQYDNAIGSGCTSLGKYKIGNPYQGKFGLAYKLLGLDKTNNNAYSRFVVLHAHDCVPDSETEGDICQSLGCPTVSPAFLKKLEAMIDKSASPVLLWIFN